MTSIKSETRAFTGCFMISEKCIMAAQAFELRLCFPIFACDARQISEYYLP